MTYDEMLQQVKALVQGVPLVSPDGAEIKARIMAMIEGTGWQVRGISIVGTEVRIAVVPPLDYFTVTVGRFDDEALTAE